MIIHASVASHVGKIRDNNEDNVNFNGWMPNEQQLSRGFVTNAEFEDEFSVCVCDGMGGELFGEEASRIAVETFTLFSKISSEQILMEYVTKANNQICNLMIEKKARIGSTFAGLYLNKSKVYIANLGDSKIFRYRSGAFTQMSHDHTSVQSMIDNAVITKEQAIKNRIRNSLTQHLGIFDNEIILEPHYCCGQVCNGDIYLVCSDGLTDMISCDNIKDIIEKSSKIEELSKSLVISALNNGGRDNITVTVVKCEEL